MIDQVADQDGYEVFAYGDERLRDALCTGSGTPVRDLEQKTHWGYLKAYLRELGTRTLLVEQGYVDRDFLEDYAAYYVRCFRAYDRLTTRLHLFRMPFDQARFRAILLGTEADTTDLQDSYLGFIVVKPLPGIVIGRTCLRTYDDDDGRRWFPILRRYSANLFGIRLSVESLAYQEQDTVVAACATSALWSCLQGTGKLYQHAIPTPVEITRAATFQVPENLPANSARALSRIAV